MKDAGYTLAEAVAALTILGLALGGLGLVVGLIGRQQMAATRSHGAAKQARAAEHALERLVQDQGPVTPGGQQGFTGKATALLFTCAARVCAARLEATSKGVRLIVTGPDGVTTTTRLKEASVQFSYTDALGSTDQWPRPNGGTLRAIVLRRDPSTPPLAMARIWLQEPRDCQFDPVIKACREEAP